MKYLRLHTLIWYVVCLLIVATYVVMFVMANIFNFVWSFRVLKWRDVFYKISELPYQNSESYIDDSPAETYRRLVNNFDKTKWLQL